MRIVMTNIAYRLLAIMVMAFALVACEQGGNGGDNGGNDGSFDEKEPVIINFTNIEVLYNGDDVGEELSDGWLIKLYTDMEIDDLGNPIGPGYVMQLLLNVSYNEEQTPQLDKLVGSYGAQQSSSDFNPNTFVYGYMQRIDLPSGYVEVPDATFFASVAEGSTEMDIDLLDDGKVEIVTVTDGSYIIKGTLVGKKCRKRYFEWKGAIEPKTNVEPTIPNSQLKSNVVLTNLAKAALLDRGDYFYLKDESYREFLIFLVEDSITFDNWGKPQGSGDLLRIELLVPWSTATTDGVPEGTYTMSLRNENGGINRADIVPYRVVAGAPDNFSYPYWAGTWYVDFVDGVWGENYARVDGGTIKVERGEDGSHRFICDLKDCSSPSYSITADVTITKDNLMIY